MLDNSTITRTFTWARAYLEVQNTVAATMCLRRVMKSAASTGRTDRSREALQLAEEIAMECIRGGRVEEAAEILRFAASWSSEQPDVRPRAMEDRTLISMNPLLQPVALRSTRPEEPADERTGVGFENEVTRIYRHVRSRSRTASGTVIVRTVVRPRPKTGSPR